MEQPQLTKCPLYLITGFLGSGKTTFVKNAIDYFDKKKKMAVVQNEFAPASIDGKELKRLTNKDFDLLEVNNGSVFCVCLLSGFIQSLQKFIEKYQPQVILMEASGLSDPVGIGEMFNNPVLQDKIYLAGSICIIDSNNFLKLEPIQQRVKHQVMIADHIIINKTDLSNETQNVITRIDKLNPLGKKFVTKYCNISLEDIFSNPENLKNKADLDLFFIKGSGRPDINSVVLRTAKPVKVELFDQFKDEINKEIIRLKGYVLLDNGNTTAFHSIFNEIKTEDIDTNIKQTELIAMGDQLDIKSFKQRYLQFT